MRARPTLTNPRNFTTLSSLSRRVASREGISCVYYVADGGGGDIYVSIPQVVNGGLLFTNFRNAVVLGCHVVQNNQGVAPNYGPENADGLEANWFTGTLHIEGCFVNQRYMRADCLCTSNVGPNAQVVIQACRFLNPILVGPLPGHGDIYHAQGSQSGNVLKALYVEYLTGITAGQGFQISTQTTFKGTGVQFLSIKNCIITRKGTPITGNWKTFNIGTLTGGGQFADKSPSNGGELDDFYLCTQYTNGNRTPYSMVTFNSDPGIRQTAQGWVYFASSWNITGFIKPGNIDNIDFAPEARVGLNYDRAWFETGGEDPTVDHKGFCSLFFNNEVRGNLTNDDPTQEDPTVYVWQSRAAAAPTYVGKSALTVGTSSTLNIPWPSGKSVNDIAFLSTVVSNNFEATPQTQPNPIDVNGWTEIELSHYPDE